MGDQHELHLIRHFFHDFGEPADVRVIERGIDLVEQTERSRVELEDGEDQRNGRQRFLTTRQQMNRADSLAGRTRHDGDARIQQVIRLEFEVRISAPEQTRKQDAEAFVRAVEGLPEAGPL